MVSSDHVAVSSYHFFVSSQGFNVSSYHLFVSSQGVNVSSHHLFVSSAVSEASSQGKNMLEGGFLALEARVWEPELHFVMQEVLSVAKLPVLDACGCAWPARATERTGHLGAD